MAIYKRFSNSDDEKGQHKHEPEFIYIDDQEERGERVEILQSQEEEYLESLQHIEDGPYPLFLRFLTFFGSIMLALFSVVILIALAVSSCLSMLFLFRNQTLNQLRAKYWRMFRKLTVFSLGTFIATFSPAFGIGIITLYFLLLGEDLDNHHLYKMMMSRFYK